MLKVTPGRLMETIWDTRDQNQVHHMHDKLLTYCTISLVPEIYLHFTSQLFSSVFLSLMERKNIKYQR